MQDNVNIKIACNKRTMFTHFSNTQSSWLAHSLFTSMLNCPFESFGWLDHYRAGSLCDDVKFGQRFVKRLFDTITS